MVKVFKGIIAVLLACMLACMAYVHFNQKGLSKKVLALLRGQIATELEVGTFDVNVLTAFPRVAFDMKQVRLRGKGSGDLIQVEQLRAVISLFSILSDNIRLRRIILENGEIAVNRLDDGSLSLEVLDTPGGDNSSGTCLAFHRIDLRNIRLSYLDRSSNQDFAINFKEGTIRGIYRHGQLNLNLEGDVMHEHVKFGSDVFLNGASGSVAGNIDLNFTDRLFNFHHLELRIDAQEYLIDGSVRVADDHQYVDFKIRQETGEIASLLTMLPPAYRRALPVNDPGGSVSAEGFIRGRMSQHENPHIHCDFRITKAHCKSPGSMGTLQDLAISGTFDNGAFRRLQSSVITLPLISGRARGQQFNGGMTITDLIDPVVTCTFDGALPADFVLDYIPMEETLKEVDGTLHFSDVALGPLRLSSANLTDVGTLHGRCRVDQLSIRTHAAAVIVPSGELSLDRDTLRITDLKLRSKEDQLSLSGWVGGLGDALQSGDPAYVRYAMEVDASTLNINTWMPDVAHDSGVPEARVVPVSGHVAVPLRMPEGNMRLKAVKFRYEDISVDALDAEVLTWKHLLKFNISGHSAGGLLQASGEMETSRGYEMHLRLSGNAVEVSECFAQCRNFGQDVFRAEHLHGKCDLILLADIPWDLDGNLQADRIHVLAGMSMTDGELVGFGMLDQFSSYVHTEDLKHVKFSRLDNFIEVRKGNVYIPTMFIQSNAANFVVNGVHTLDNRILYNLKINAGQVLSSKMKKRNPSMTPLPARKDGTFNLFFTISGNTEAFTYSMNRTSVESSFEQSAEMRQRIRDDLKQVFGETVDLIEPPEWETIPEYEREVQGEEVYLEWKQ